MTSYPRHVFSMVNGLRLHHLDHEGEGQPIILIHGVLGHAWTWQGVAPHLTGEGRIIAVDLRGYGESQWSAPKDYATKSFASDLVGLADAHGWERATIVGFSLGGLVGLAVWEQQPDLVERIVMIDLPPASTKAATDIPPVVMAVPDQESAIEAERAMAPRASAHLLEEMANHGRRPGPGGELIRRHDPLFAERWPFRTEDWWDTVDRIDVPLLFIHAAASQICPPEMAGDVVERAANGRLVTIGDSGHLIPLEQPEDLTRHLVEFLEES